MQWAYIVLSKVKSRQGMMSSVQPFVLTRSCLSQNCPTALPSKGRRQYSNDNPDDSVQVSNWCLWAIPLNFPYRCMDHSLKTTGLFSNIYSYKNKTLFLCFGPVVQATAQSSASDFLSTTNRLITITYKQLCFCRVPPTWLTSLNKTGPKHLTGKSSHQLSGSILFLASSPQHSSLC